LIVGLLLKLRRSNFTPFSLAIMGIKKVLVSRG